MDREVNLIPDADESIKFWSGIWDNETEHNNEAEWLNEIKQGIGPSKPSKFEDK